MPSGQVWSEGETILAFYYYCQIPFAKISSKHPVIMRIADLIGRTPSAVALKMGNLGHFDPTLRERNINGLRNASRRDEVIVHRFMNDWETLSFEAQKYEAIFQQKVTEYLPNAEVIQLPEDMDREANTVKRSNQVFFQKSVFGLYDNTCCITGIQIPSLLTASHIKPWTASKPKTERVNPCNGLCLNALHGRAFENGLITILPDYTIQVSSHLNGTDEASIWLRAYDKKKIRTPDQLSPAKEFLEYHNDVIFIR